MSNTLLALFFATLFTAHIQQKMTDTGVPVAEHCTTKATPDSLGCSVCADKFVLVKQAPSGALKPISEPTLCTLKEGKPIEIDKNCIAVGETKNCIACSPGYFVNDNKCEACLKGCNHCKSKDTCGQCKEGFFINKNECSECPSGCGVCENGNSCKDCLPGTFMNADKKTCTYCISSQTACLTCESATTCSKCVIGSPSDDKKKCDIIAAIEGIGMTVILVIVGVVVCLLLIPLLVVLCCCCGFAACLFGASKASQSNSYNSMHA